MVKVPKYVRFLPYLLRLHSQLKTELKRQFCVLMAHRSYSKLETSMKIKFFDLNSNFIFILLYFILLISEFYSVSILLSFYFYSVSFLLFCLNLINIYFVIIIIYCIITFVIFLFYVIQLSEQYY